MCDSGDSAIAESSVIFHNFRRRLIESNYQSECRKCGDRGYVLLQKADVYCGPCLREYCVRKFRSTLGKSRLVRPGERVLVAFSGDTNSRVLLDLVTRGLREDIHRKLRFSAGVLYVDDSALFDQPDTSRVGLVGGVLAASGLECYFTSLEQVLQQDSISVLKLPPGFTPAEWMSRVVDFRSGQSALSAELVRMVSQVDSPTSRRDFLKPLRRCLLQRVASHLSFSKLFSASNMDNLASTLLADICLGRGANVQGDTAFSDTRFESVPLVRPLRHLSSKEVVFYARLASLQPVPPWPAPPAKASIHHLSDTLLSHLQHRFPSTSFTIFNTGSKVTASRAASSQARCCLCRAPTHLSHSELAASDALELTSKLSAGLDADCEQDSKGDSSESHLCYPCLRIHNQMDPQARTLLARCLVPH